MGHDGKTPYEMMKGKMAKLQGMEFGEDAREDRWAS